MKRNFLVKALAVICAFIVPCMMFSACFNPPEKEDDTGVVTPNPDEENKNPVTPNPVDKDPKPDDKDPETPDEKEKYTLPPLASTYDYKPNLFKDIARIDINTDDGSNDWATVYFPTFDNYNPNNNIDWQYQSCTVSVSGCEKEYEFSDVAAEVKVRGNWTTTYDKKPFRIKFKKKHSMLGLNDGAECKSWVLLANYKDVSLLRNSIAFYLGQQFLASDGYYCSDYRFVDLYLNGQNWGSYLLCEQQQVNKNRININEPEEGYTGTDIGYFFEFDGYYNLEIENERFELNYNNGAQLKNKDGNSFRPEQKGYSIKNDIYSKDQKQFIQNYMNNLYNICYNAVYKKQYYTFNENLTGLVKANTADVLTTVAKVIDIDSLVNTYILNEIACDADIGWSSFHMNVDLSATGNKLLRFEGPWDFDSAYGLRNACEGADWLYAANSSNPWLVMFINEPWFQNRIKEKWQNAKANNVQKNTLELIKTYQNLYSGHFNSNFGRWDWNSVYWRVCGEFCWGAQQVSNQTQAKDYFYNWLNKRFNYLDNLWSK